MVSQAEIADQDGSTQEESLPVIESVYEKTVGDPPKDAPTSKE